MALQLNALYEQLEIRKCGRAWTTEERALSFVGDLAKLIQVRVPMEWIIKTDPL